MVPHEDKMQDRDMIKTVLQKIVDEMGSMEADRIMPESRKPKVMKMEVETIKPVEDMEDDELNPAVLDELIAKAGEADESGELPEDRENGLPPEISDAIRRRKETR